MTTFWKGFSHVRPTLALVWRFAPYLTATVAFLAVLSAFLPVGIAWVGKQIVDAVVAKDPHATAIRVGIELVLVILLSATGRGQRLAWQILGARLSVDVNLAILEKAGTLELRQFEDPNFYDRLVRARREASSRPLGVVTDVFGLIQNLLSLIGFAGLLVTQSPLVVIGLLIAGIPAAVAEMRAGAEQFKLRNWRAPETRRLNYLEHVLANDKHAKEVMLFGLGPLFAERYRTLAEKFYREDTQTATKRAGTAWALSMLSTLAYYGTYAFLAFRAATGVLTVGDLTLAVAAFRQGQSAFQAVLASIGGMYEDNLYMSNLFEYLQYHPERTVPPGGPIREERGLRFENVGFKYPGTEKWAVRGIDLFVEAGTSLALVGHNGAGKTTLIKLMVGLYEPSEGRVLLDGRDLRDWPPEELRRRIGVIFQDFIQYQLDVAENVGVGSVEHLADRPRIERAIEAGGATDVVKALPKGVDTQLGRWFNEGMELSGGQWQRIGVARAFAREEADVLVLDEPTAALDAEAEHAVFERFRALTKGRTAILVSHRFPTVRMADRIVVLDGGAIVESGTHEELVARGERYANLFALQARGYL